MALGAAIDKPQIIERPIRHIDVCPTLTEILSCRGIESQGAKLAEFRV
jgi:hypothetical protein